MGNATENVPAESDVLCENCGYVLNGLGAASNCPECGRPIADSRPELRKGPAWEQPGGLAVRFAATSWDLLFHPAHFYRTFATRGDRGASRRFALIYFALVSLLLGIGAYVHFSWFIDLGTALPTYLKQAPAITIVVLSAVVFLCLDGITRIAARLTNWEATYRGLRLPLNAVLRGLDYHAAHYLPVALVSSLTMIGYRVALTHQWAGPASAPTYLYVLSGEVILAAVYLFQTYWIAMRNIMYANG